MRVLIVGSGAREHALAWRIHRDGDTEVLCAPGNAGTKEVARPVDVSATDRDAVVFRAKQEQVDLVVIGPEAPLVEGVADALRDAGIPTFGPSASAARLEGSKVFAKRFMSRHGIPTAAFEVFHDPDEADRYVRAANRPLVIKADGLAAGKGVVVADDAAEAADAIDRMMRRREFGEAGAAVVIEERIAGDEVSYHVVADGFRYVPLAPAEDHKRVYEGDRGPNTGGMGAYSPPPVVTADVEAAIQRDIIEPTLRGMHREGIPYAGALFVGLMVVDGQPRVLEYNVRFGDPEAEVLMARWKGASLPLFAGAARGDLRGVEPQWEAPASLCAVLASGGYPGAYEKGKAIRGLEQARELEGVHIFHAGTKRQDDRVLTAGGRVLAVVGVGSDVDGAAERAYAAADCIHFDGKHFRRDIGHRARTR